MDQSLIEDLAAKYILDTEDEQDVHLQNVLHRFCMLWRENKLTKLLTWCLKRDLMLPKRSGRSRLMMVVREIMEHRPDGTDIARHIFFIRCANMHNMKETIEFIIQHRHFRAADQLLQEMRTARAHAHTDEQQKKFLQAAIDLLCRRQAAHDNCLDDLRRRILIGAASACSVYVNRADLPSNRITSHNSVDPLSLCAVAYIPNELRFAVDGYVFDVIAFAKFLHIDNFAEDVTTANRPHLPKHPFTCAPITGETVKACRSHLLSLCRKYDCF